MIRIYEKKTDAAFRELVIAATFVLCMTVFLSYKIYKEADIYLGVLYHHIHTVCQCTDVVQFLNMHPVIFAEVGVFAFAVSSFMIFSIRRFFKLYVSTNKYVNYYLSLALKKPSWKLRSVIGELDIPKEKITELKSDDAVVFCHGLLRPGICISSSLVKLLDKSELKAVLMHEKQHMESYEPFKLFVAIYLQNILFILPGIRNLAKKYFTFSELSADERACIESDGKLKIANAIYKIAEHKEYRSESGIASPVIFERVNRLANDAYSPTFRNLGKSLVACSFFFVILSAAILFALSNSSKAFDMHSGSLCVLADNKKLDLLNVFFDKQNTCDMHDRGHVENNICNAQ